MTLQNFQLDYKGQYNNAFYFYFDSVNQKAVLLYSWVLPVQEGDKKWFKREDGSKFISIIGSFDADQIKNLWGGLLSGKSFETAAVDSKIDLDFQTTQLELIKSWSFPFQDYVYRPNCTYSTKNEWGNDQDLFCSPSQKVIANVETLFCLNKEDFFHSTESFEALCEFLRKETGIPFFRVQASRIGNVEWYTFPSGNIDEKSFVQIEPLNEADNQNHSCRKVKVSITGDVPGDYLINLRCINGKAITCDIIREITVIDTEISIEFEASEEISSLKVMVWRRKDEEWLIWFEKELSLLRYIGMDINLSVGAGSVESKKFSRLKTEDQKLLKKIAEIQKVNLFRKSSKSTIGTDKYDRWNSIIKETDAVVRKHYPAKSDAMFLPRGWDGHFQFFEWIKQLPSKVSDLKEIILVDPYVDEEALRLIPHFGAVHANYILIANTMARSVIARLSLQEMASKLFEKIKQFNVTIYDVKEEKQLIHDRYILLKDSEDLIVKGYHLSNSIQKANINYPLLITEISRDVLFEIQNWLSTILNTNLEILWDSKSHHESKKFSRKIVVDKNDYSVLTVDDIMKEAHVRWAQICENAYNNNKTMNNLFRAARNFTDKMWNDICADISNYIESCRLDDIPNVANAIMEFLKETDFASSLDKASNLFDHFHRAFGISPALYFLIECTARYKPERLLVITDELYEKLPNLTQNDNGVAYFFQQLSNSLVLAFRFYGDSESIWINCKANLFVGLAVSSLFRKIYENKLAFDDTVNSISSLDLIKKLKVLEQWIFELRVIENRHGSDVSTKPLRVEIFNKIRNIWPDSADKEIVKDILIRCGGPGRGNWACSTVTELFIPLLDEGKLSVMRVWETIGDLCSEQLDDCALYSNRDSLNIFEVFGWVAARDGIDPGTYLDELDKIVKAEIRNIAKPFAASISYAHYSSSIIKLHKILLVLLCIMNYKKEDQKVTNLILHILNQMQGSERFLATPNEELNKSVAIYLKKFNDEE